MAIYTVGRRQVIVALLLSSVLLLTLDLRGNPVLDRIRGGFTQVMSPVETAADVVATPIERGWNSYQNYDELERENEVLREIIDRQIGEEATAVAAVRDYQLLLSLSNLPSLTNIPTELAQVVGGASNNIDQIVEINKGTNQGIEVGMPVVNRAGLIGKITEAFPTTSRVMLITDSRYAIPVEILGGTGEDLGTDEPVLTTPSGNTDEENDQAVADAVEAAEIAAETGGDLGTNGLPSGDPAVPTTTLPPPQDAADGADADDVDPVADDTGDGDTEGEPGEGDTDEADAGEIELDASVEIELDADGNPVSTTTTTTTTIPDPDAVELQKEFGLLEGRGAGKPTQIRFVQDSPSLAVLEVGDLVETAGGSQSLAPENIPVGRVINRAPRPGVAGPVLEIELNADLDTLNFVRVVLFRPPSEIGEVGE